MARPLGSKNKRPSAIAIGQSLAAKGIDLAEKYLAIADDVNVAPEIRLRALDSLARYSQVVPTPASAASDGILIPADADAVTDDDLVSSLS